MGSKDTKVVLVDKDKFAALKGDGGKSSAKVSSLGPDLSIHFPPLVGNARIDETSVKIGCPSSPSYDQTDSKLLAAGPSRSDDRVTLKGSSKDAGKSPSMTQQSKWKKSKSPMSVAFCSLLMLHNQKSRNRALKNRKLLGKFKHTIPSPSFNSIQYRGRHRENKKKRKTVLKRNIVNERAMKKLLACNGLEPNPVHSSASQNTFQDNSDKPSTEEFQLHEKTHEPENLTPAPAVKHHVEKAVADENSPGPTILKKEYSNKFRRYCSNAITKELNAAVQSLVEMLVELQDRAFARDPIRARAKKRFVTGLREANKYMQLKRVKMLVVPPDLENSESLNKCIEDLKILANHENVASVFALDRRKLGHVSLRKAPVSAFTILNYEGLEPQYQKVLEEHSKASAILNNTVPQKQSASTTRASVIGDEDTSITRKLAQVVLESS